jgi:hypothetical protein
LDIIQETIALGAEISEVVIKWHGIT